MEPKWAQKLEAQTRRPPLDQFHADLWLIAAAAAGAIPLAVGGAKAAGWLITSYAADPRVGVALALFALLALLVFLLTLVARTFGAKTFAGSFLPALALLGVFTATLFLETFP